MVESKCSRICPPEQMEKCPLLQPYAGMSLINDAFSMKSERTVCGLRLSLCYRTTHDHGNFLPLATARSDVTFRISTVEPISLSIKSFNSSWLLPRVIVSLKTVLWLYLICNILSVFIEQNYLKKNFDTWYILSISNLAFLNKWWKKRKLFFPERILYIRYRE